MKIITHPDLEIQNLLIQQAGLTRIEIIEICAEICDKNRGHLQVGDMLRKLLPSSPPVSGDVPPDNKPKSHLSVVK